MTVKVPSALKVARICKEINPQIKIVFGGHHPTILPEEMLSHHDVDFVVRGEGEKTFYELLQAMESRQKQYNNIAGLSFRKGDALVHNDDRPLIKDLNTIPAPARDLIWDVETYTPGQLSTLMTSRGCPYDCGFCAAKNIWRRRVRFRSMDSILDEIGELRDRYGLKDIRFYDDSFTVRRSHIEQLCHSLIEKQMDITWSCLTRVDIISDDLIALMKKAGCTKVEIGVESGNKRVLALIGKGATIEEVSAAAQCLSRNKISWSAFFMFGFPTETEEEALDTLRFMKELKPNWAHISIFTPYPGTDLYDLALKTGMITESFDHTLHSHHNPYLRHTDTIPQERFQALSTHILAEVHRYNKSSSLLLRRALTRNYHKNPALLVQDARKLWTWLRN